MALTEPTLAAHDPTLARLEPTLGREEPKSALFFKQANRVCVPAFLNLPNLFSIAK